MVAEDPKYSEAEFHIRLKGNKKTYNEMECGPELVILLSCSILWYIRN